jgi:hypothetical protein
MLALNTIRIIRCFELLARAPFVDYLASSMAQHLASSISATTKRLVSEETSISKRNAKGKPRRAATAQADRATHEELKQDQSVGRCTSTRRAKAKPAPQMLRFHYDCYCMCMLINIMFILICFLLSCTALGDIASKTLGFSPGSLHTTVFVPLFCGM